MKILRLVNRLYWLELKQIQKLNLESTKDQQISQPTNLCLKHPTLIDSRLANIVIEFLLHKLLFNIYKHNQKVKYKNQELLRADRHYNPAFKVRFDQKILLFTLDKNELFSFWEFIF